MTTKAAILLVDDETAFLDSVARMLRIEGYDDLTPIADPTQVEALLERKSFDLAFLDITMPKLDGLDLLKLIKEQSPETECIMVTANEQVPLILKAGRLGAYDYLVKPILPEQLTHALERALEHKRLWESLQLRSKATLDRVLKSPEAFAAIVTASRAMKRLLREAELHAASAIPVLITGDTGVGKELLARAVHDASRRAKGPFVPVNMLALSPTLFESEFFGHVKGSFTGADRDRTGYLAQAKGGTLFLDEIGDLPMEIQGKLLRILQENEFTPVGSTKTERADGRFVAATNQDLDKLVQQRKFRKDLLYRLQFAHLHLPSLAERKDDIPVLAAHILGGHERDVRLSEEAEALLVAYDWPGNVRELKGVLEAAANLAEDGLIRPSHLRINVRAAKAQPATLATTPTGGLEPMAEVERRHILAVYEAVGMNKSQAARVLDIGLQTLHRKLKTYGVK
ncbi:MAG: sigma-54-dependent Fis family transcriptional regulator [Myxococcales bacterium]|nr:MAG: sigma-54-dependent Fis family transcriptional regulator [Myxococcales bacterium]